MPRWRQAPPVCSASISKGRSSTSIAKGIHDPEKIRALDEDGFAAVTASAAAAPSSPSRPNRPRPRWSRRLADAGLIVAAGHTDGSYREIREALDSGLTGFTHLFNAMSPLGSREPGVVGAALEDEAAWCGLDR